MKHLFIFVATLALFVCVVYSAPLDNKDTNNKDPKSAFGPAFDEIVVESQLTVRRKNNARQARTQNVSTEATSAIIKTKREINLPLNNRHQKEQHTPSNLFTLPPKSFGASAANSQSQTFNSFGPLGNFGASASGAQTQGFNIGPNGLVESNLGFSGTQQYVVNGQTIDIAFGNVFSGGNGTKAGGASITVTGTDGKKRPFNG